VIVGKLPNAQFTRHAKKPRKGIDSFSATRYNLITFTGATDMAEQHILTKDDIHAIRNANDICIHLGARHPNGLVRLIKRKPYNGKPFETDQEYELGATVTFETSEGRRALESGSASCFAMEGIYHSQRSPVSSILNTLKVGDHLTFSFWPDAHSNAYVAAAGLHADALYLHVRDTKGKRKSWELSNRVCTNNSARMCRGVPSGRSYEQAAEEGRKIG
jgi:hypothetical protein